MSEETKKDTPREPAEEIELSNQDLEQVAGGGTTQTTSQTQSQAAHKAAQAMTKYSGS
jgi:hypothetical protein